MIVTKFKSSWEMSCHRQLNLITIKISVLVTAVFCLPEKLMDHPKHRIVKFELRKLQVAYTCYPHDPQLCSLVNIVHTHSRHGKYAMKECGQWSRMHSET